MRRFIIAILSLLVVASITVSATLASSVHFKDKASPTFTDLGLVLNAAGSLAGLGYGDVLVALDAVAMPTASCTNPAGQTQPPGQNPAAVNVSGSQAIPAGAFKNGNTPFTVTTNAPQTPIPGAPGCPNTQWTEAITDMTFTSATITVYQGGQMVLQKTFTGAHLGR
jgi:hypothetical protein